MQMKTFSFHNILLFHACSLQKTHQNPTTNKTNKQKSPNFGSQKLAKEHYENLRNPFPILSKTAENFLLTVKTN